MGRPAEGGGIDDGGEAADDTVGAQAIDAALDRGGAEGDVGSDVLEGTPGILLQQRNDSPVDRVHRCRLSAETQQITLVWARIQADHELMAATTSTSPRVDHRDAPDFMPLHGIDHIELYVGNAAQAAYFYARAFGFREVAYAGLETGRRDRVSHVLEQGRVRLVLTGTLLPDSDIARHHAAH